MKKLLFIALLAIISFAAKAQFSVKNYTGCEIMVTVYCYDANCNISSHSVLIGGAGFPGIPNGGNVNYCNNPSDYMLIKVCFYDYPGAPCDGEYGTLCVMVDGDPQAPPTFACPIFPISPNTYTGDIQACPRCDLNGGTGAATVTFDPITQELTIL